MADDDIEEIEILDEDEPQTSALPKALVDDGKNVKTDDKCMLCHGEFRSDAAWLKHIKTTVHLKKLKVYNTLMESVDSDSGASLIQTAIRASPSRDILLGQSNVHEVRGRADGAPRLLFWACSVCYVADTDLSAAVAHLGEMRHRLDYIEQFHEDQKPSGADAATVQDRLLEVSRRLNAAEADQEPELMRLLPSVNADTVLKDLGLSAKPAVTAVAADAPKVIKASGDEQLLWCDECWATLVIDRKVATAEDVWAKHKITPNHLKKIAQRRKLSIDEKNFISAEPSLPLQREMSRTRHLLGLDHMVERYGTWTGKAERRRDVVCLLCAEVLEFQDVYAHVMGRAHLGQFLHKEEPSMIVTLSKTPREGRKAVMEGYSAARKVASAAMRVQHPDAAALLRDHLARRPTNGAAPDKLRRLQGQVFLLMLESERGDLTRLPGDPSGTLQHTLKTHKAPLIGLQYVCEMVCNGDGAEPSYICQACPSWETMGSLFIHVISDKHRMAVLELENRKEELGNLRKLSSKEKAKALDDMAAKLEKASGRKPMKFRLRFRPSVHILERLWPAHSWQKKKEPAKKNEEAEKMEEESRKRKASSPLRESSRGRDDDSRRRRSRSRSPARGSSRWSHRRSRSRSPSRSQSRDDHRDDRRSRDRERASGFDMDMTSSKPAAPPPQRPAPPPQAYVPRPIVRTNLMPTPPNPLPNMSVPPPSFRPTMTAASGFAPPPPPTSASSLMAQAGNLSKEEMLKMLLQQEAEQKKATEERERLINMLMGGGGPSRQPQPTSAAVPAAPAAASKTSGKLANALKALSQVKPAADQTEAAMAGLASWAGGKGAARNSTAAALNPAVLDQLAELLHQPRQQPNQQGPPPPGMTQQAYAAFFQQQASRRQ